MPLGLLKSASADLVSNLESQLKRAQQLTNAVAAYKRSSDPQDLIAVARHFQRLRRLHEVMANTLFTADAALTVAGMKVEDEDPDASSPPSASSV